MASYLQYPLLKATVTLMRFGVKTFQGLPIAHPDRVLEIPSRDAGRSIRTHIYEPSTSAKKPGPVLINFHGSGWMMPCHGESDKFCRRIADETGFTVIDSTYSMAPENPFPAAQHDAEDVVRYVLSRPETYDIERVAISGSSAGAHNALVTAAVTFPKDTFKAIITFYPPVDFSIKSSVRNELHHSSPPVLKPWLMDLIDWNYLQDSTLDRKDPRISPVFAETSRFPRRALLICGDSDSLAYDSGVLANKLRQDPGIEVQYHLVEGLDHAWDVAPDLTPDSVAGQARDKVYQAAVDFLNSS